MAALGAARARGRDRGGRAVPGLLDVRDQRAAVVAGAVAPAAAVPPADAMSFAAYAEVFRRRPVFTWLTEQHDRRRRLGDDQPRDLDAGRLLAVALPHTGAARGGRDAAAVQDAAGQPDRHPVLRDVHDDRADRQPGRADARQRRRRRAVRDVDDEGLLRHAAARARAGGGDRRLLADPGAVVRDPAAREARARGVRHLSRDRRVERVRVRADARHQARELGRDRRACRASSASTWSTGRR